MRTTAERLSEQLDQLAAEVSCIVGRHPGRLVALTVAVPPPLTSPGFEREVERHLCEVGLDFIDVQLTPNPGPLRVLTAEFER